MDLNDFKEEVIKEARKRILTDLTEERTQLIMKMQQLQNKKALTTTRPTPFQMCIGVAVLGVLGGAMLGMVYVGFMFVVKLVEIIVPSI